MYVCMYVYMHVCMYVCMVQQLLPTRLEVSPVSPQPRREQQLLPTRLKVSQRAPKAKQTANTRATTTATTTASASATAKARLSTRAETFGIFCILGAAQNHCTGWVNQRPSGQNPCTVCIDYKRGILMVQFALLESRFRCHSLHSGAWCRRLAAQAAAIRA